MLNRATVGTEPHCSRRGRSRSRRKRSVEGWFVKLTPQRLKRGVFTSIVELHTAIHRFIADANGKPKPFVWTKSADATLAAVTRGRQTLDAIH
jgi:hypothetical protein